MDEAVALHGVDGDSESGTLFRRRLWWPVLWLATLFELWKAWSGKVYGGKACRSKEAILCSIWEHWVVAGWALEQGRPRVFKDEQWVAIGTRGQQKFEWRMDCPWVQPHLGSDLGA